MSGIYVGLSSGNVGIGTGGVNALGAKLNVTGDMSAGFLIGQVSFFTMSTAPTGWLKCNGAAISRTTYAKLFAVTGTTYGVGNGSTTFNLPDLRGEFIRGWDDGRGVDTTGGARAFGTYQKGTIVAFNTPYNEGFTETLTASLDSNPNNGRIAVGADPANIADYPNTGKAFTSTGVSSTVAPFDWINTDQYGGGISRPRNVALLACIKF